MTPIHLVLLPGLDGTGILFNPLLKALPAHIQPIVIAYPSDQKLGYDELLPIVLKSLPTNAPFILLGESFGGPLSLRVAASKPQGLKALILCATFVSCPHWYVPKWAASLVCAWPFRAFPMLSRLKAFLGHYATDELLALSHAALSSVKPEVFAHRLREVIRVDVSSELAACDLPILYLQGKHDWVVPGWNSKTIRRIKPAVHLAEIPTSHMVLQIQPNLAANAISQFSANSMEGTMNEV